MKLEDYDHLPWWYGFAFISVIVECGACRCYNMMLSRRRNDTIDRLIRLSFFTRLGKGRQRIRVELAFHGGSPYRSRFFLYQQKRQKTRHRQYNKVRREGHTRCEPWCTVDAMTSRMQPAGPPFFPAKKNSTPGLRPTPSSAPRRNLAATCGSSA